MHSRSLFTGAIALAGSVNGQMVKKAEAPYKYVAFFSVDGFHGSDVEKYVAARPKSTIAELLENGYEYTNAYTTGPSDSFPGTMAQMTGAGPSTTGIWYDDSYDRSLYNPSSNCSAPPGAEVQYTEINDYNDTLLFSGGIDPANLPQAYVAGKCIDLCPQQRLRVNTIFEVARAAGLTTAYADKHPAYAIARGPSNTGLSTGYFPEIQSIPTLVNYTIGFDELHVSAFLDWVDGKTPANSSYGSLNGKTPNLFGGNFQSINVAEKQYGYQASSGNPFTTGLLSTFDFVDKSFAKIVAALKKKGIFEDTLIIVASKHGQSPINPTLYNKINPDLVMNATGVSILQETSDTIALLWLANQTETATAVAGLQKNAQALKIKDIIYGTRLVTEGYGNPLADPAVPDIIVNPENGVIYTNSKSKIAEHGGLHDDDRHVACFISNPKLKKQVFTNEVSTKQVAPTIMKALGLDPNALRGVVEEGTKPLNGF